MKLTIDNLGKVGHAEISLDGITVIAGENGSGKSTISRALMTISTASSHIGEWVEHERIRSLFDETARILTEKGLRSRSYVIEHGILKHLLTSSFWDHTNAVTDWIKQSFGHDVSGGSKALGTTGIPVSVLVANTAKQILATSDQEYEAFALNNLCNRALGAWLGTLADENAESTMFLETDDGIVKTICFKNGKVDSFLNVGSGVVAPTFYVEPLHGLDAVAQRDVSFLTRTWKGSDFLFHEDDSDWNGVLLKNPTNDFLSLEATKRQSAVNAVLDRIVATIHGELQKEERELLFIDSDFGSFVPIKNMASGAKTIAMLIRGLRNGRIASDGLVIIDEPESNLHPDWQVRFAEFLVLLHARFSLRLLLNTHSPYFLKAIQTYSDRLDVHDTCRYYKMERKGGAVLYSSRDVTGDIEPVFADMSRPYARLLYGDSYDGNPSR